MNFILVFLGGGIGASLRYILGQSLPRGETSFPLGTFLINIIGSFLISFFSIMGKKLAWDPRLILFLQVGLCGGFTTFSSFSLETFQLIHSGKSLLALGYVVMSPILCLGGGFWLILSSNRM